MTTKIILTRHGHVEGIAPRRFRGRADVPLTDLGVAQAKATATRIAASWPNAVLTSPMTRCVATASAVAEECGVPASVLYSLNDLDYGAWQWKTHDDIARKFPELYATWLRRPHLFRFPSGESLQDLVARAGDTLRCVLREHRDRTVVLVAHESVNRALLMQILDQPLSAYWRLVFEPCGISEIDFVDNVPWVLRINETFHLAGVPDRAAITEVATSGRDISRAG